MNQIKVKKVNKNAIIPKRATNGSAGYDLHACIKTDITIKPNEIVKIPVGIAIELPDEYHVCLIYPRSGIASKHGISLVNCVGVIDSDYRGEIIIPLINQKNEIFVIKNEDRIAQLVITPIVVPEIIEVESLSETIRGSGGFGSTAIGNNY